MTPIDALIAQLLKLSHTPAALSYLAVLAQGDEARHVALLTAAYQHAVYDHPAAVLALCKPADLPPSLPSAPRPACRCGARAGLTRLGSSEGRWCRGCYSKEIERRKELSK